MSDWWPEHWRDAILARAERISVRPTRIFVAPALRHLAWDVLLTAEARRAPLHRLRYRWSLRRRAPAWRRRAAGRPLRKSDWRVRPGTWDWENTRTGETSLLHPKTLAICRQHDPWDCPDCGAENQPSNRACDRCGGLPIRQAAA